MVESARGATQHVAAPDSGRVAAFQSSTSACSHGRLLLAKRDGDRLVLETASLTVSVVRDGVSVWSSAFENISGDCPAATFSPDGRFVMRVEMLPKRKLG